MYNKIILIGRLVADPELRQTSSGASVCSFRIAVQRNYAARGTERQTDFLDIVAWRQQAEFVTRYFHKGNMIGVEGRLETREFTDRNNQQRRVYEVISDNLFFVESRAAANSSAGGNASYGNSSFAGNAPVSGGNAYGSVPASTNTGSDNSPFSSGDFGDFQEIDSDEDLPF